MWLVGARQTVWWHTRMSMRAIRIIVNITYEVAQSNVDLIKL